MPDGEESQLAAQRPRCLHGLDPISTSTCYHPDCLVDHHDSRFNDHVGVNLYQKDIRDIRGQLVEPWKMQEVYRPGTLVLAVCTFKMWSQGKDGSEEPNHVGLVIRPLRRQLNIRR